MANELGKQITLGKVADSAKIVASLNKVSDKELATILRTIADLL